MPLTILGISAFYHDSAACVVRDGEIIAAAQEERFTRKKQDASFPQQAIAYCLREAGVSAHDLDYVGFYDKPILKFERILENYLGVAPRGISSFMKAIPLWLKEKLFTRETIRRGLGDYPGPILFKTTNFSWWPVARGVQRKLLGTFTERGTQLEVYRVDNQYGTNRASNATLYCYRCDSVHGWNFGQ